MSTCNTRAHVNPRHSPRHRMISRSAAPCPYSNEAQQEQLSFESRYANIIAECARQRQGVRVVLFVAGLHDFESGITQTATLLHLPRVMRAHVDGAHHADKCSNGTSASGSLQTCTLSLERR